MGTRGMLAFVANGREIITYNHFDSYPSHLGVHTLQWLREALKDPAALRASVVALKLVGEDDPPTEEQIAELRQHVWTAAEHGGTADLRENQEWYDLLHECIGDPALILKSGYARHVPEWPEDSLFCEWGYLIDLDGDGRLEVYRGFQQAPHDDGRFAKRNDPSQDPDAMTKAARLGFGPYYPIHLIASWPLADLPGDGDFLAALTEADEDEED